MTEVTWQGTVPLFYNLLFLKTIFWLHQVLVVSHGIFRCSAVLVALQHVGP